MPQRLAEMGTYAQSDPQLKAWRVLHACESVADAVSLAEAQSGVGMLPQLLAREYWSESKASRSPSLMTVWHDVRDWRHALNDAEALTSAQLVHAHSFAAAMAGVRGSPPLVYDFSQLLEQSGGTPAGANAGPWLLRSFRVAEQFAMSRAGAVVAHTEAIKRIACERGAAPENTFLVPEPCITRELVPDPDWAALHGIDLGYHAVLFAMPSPLGIEPTLRAFSDILAEIEHALLIFELGDLDRGRLIQMARDLLVADNIRCISADEHEQATACADLVLVPSTGDSGRCANRSMLAAMASGRAVVAADVAENRECSADGNGVIWCREADPQDLAQRVAFVARNVDFSRALGESGRAHISGTRSPHIVARCYDEIYKHAQSRRRENLPRIPVPPLYAVNVRT